MSAVKTPLELLSTPVQSYAANGNWNEEATPARSVPRAAERNTSSLMTYGWTGGNSTTSSSGGQGGTGVDGVGAHPSGRASVSSNHEQAPSSPYYPHAPGQQHLMHHAHSGAGPSYGSPHPQQSLLSHSTAVPSHGSAGSQLPPAHSIATWLSPNPGQQQMPPSPTSNVLPSTSYSSTGPQTAYANNASDHAMPQQQHASSSPASTQSSHPQQQQQVPLFTSAWASHQQQHSHSSPHYTGSGLAASAQPLASPQGYPSSVNHNHSSSHPHHHPYSAPSYTSPLPGSYANDVQGQYHGVSHYGSQQPSPALGLSPLGLDFDSYGNGHPARSRYDGHSASFSAGSSAPHESSGGALHLHGANIRANGHEGSAPYGRQYGVGGPFGLPARGSLTPATNSPSTPRTSLSAMRSISDSASAAASSSTSPAMHTLTSLHNYNTDDARWAALVNRSHSADRAFVYGALTTRIYCRPSCASKRPDRNRVKFFPFPGAAAQAEAAGFRACKRCKPGIQGTADQCVLAVGECVRHITHSAVAGENSDGEIKRKTLKEYAARAGLSAFHFHRTFKAVTSLTPGEYAKACHALALQDSIGRDATRNGDMITSQALTRALIGWSTRRARRAVGGILPSSYAAGCVELNMLQVTARDTPFGPVSVLFTDGIPPNGTDASQEECEGTLFACLVGPDAERRLQMRCPTARRLPEREAWLLGIVMELFRAGDREVQLPDEVIPIIRRARVWNAVRRDLERKGADDADQEEEEQLQGIQGASQQQQMQSQQYMPSQPQAHQQPVHPQHPHYAPLQQQHEAQPQHPQQSLSGIMNSLGPLRNAS